MRTIFTFIDTDGTECSVAVCGFCKPETAAYFLAHWMRYCFYTLGNENTIANIPTTPHRQATAFISALAYISNKHKWFGVFDFYLLPDNFTKLSMDVDVYVRRQSSNPVDNYIVDLQRFPVNNTYWLQNFAAKYLPKLAAQKYYNASQDPSLLHNDKAAMAVKLAISGFVEELMLLFEDATEGAEWCGPTPKEVGGL